jgi:DNA-binding CsgD family transcriptional regulator/class 3 adenylate cyclase
MKPSVVASGATRNDPISLARRRSVRRTSPEPTDAGAFPHLMVDVSSGRTARRDAGSTVVDLAQFRPVPTPPIPPAFPPKPPGTDCTVQPCERETLIEEIESYLAASAPELEAHRVLATVLIAGIPFSAPLAVHLGHEQWREYASSFAAVVQRQIERFGGQPRAETIDGIVAVFDSPARALQCAGSIDSAARHFGFPVRAGLHAGELEHADERLTGIAMQVTQRIFELGKSGEILVSGTVRDLVAGSPFTFEPVDKRLQTPADQRWGLFRLVADSRPVAPDPQVKVRAAEHRAKPILSRREREVAVLVANGKSNRCIAEELFIASSTVERHVANILNKLGYRSRTQIAAWAVTNGLTVA